MNNFRTIKHLGIQRQLSFSARDIFPTPWESQQEYAVYRETNQFLTNVCNLEGLALVHFHCPTDYGRELFNALHTNHGETLKILTIAESVWISTPDLSVLSNFHNLQALNLPHKFCTKMFVEALACINLKTLSLTQDKFDSSYATIDSIPGHFEWLAVKNKCPSLRVALVKNKVRGFLWPASPCPVVSITINCSHHPQSFKFLETVQNMYSDTLEALLQTNCRWVSDSRPFSDRADVPLMNLVMKAKRLHILLCGEFLSAMTVVMMSYFGVNLRYIYVRERAIILGNQWPETAVSGLLTRDAFDHLEIISMEARLTNMFVTTQTENSAALSDQAFEMIDAPAMQRWTMWKPFV